MTDITELGRDANAQIMELNKGLSSQNIGEKCKTILEFPSIVEQYPFPMVINSIFLKISDIFCEGTNYVRMSILRSCIECRSQLEHLTVSEDIVRKLLPLTTANDPTTRALTLRLFGILSRIIKENVSVHHGVISKLESRYEVELSSALWTSYELASVSKTFAINLCPVVSRLLQNFSTSTDVKLKLIPLGKFAYNDINFLPRMRECLVNLLDTHGVGKFVTAIFDTLTNLEIHSPVNTSQQLHLMLEHLRTSCALDVKLGILSNMETLANHLSNQWDASHVVQLSQMFVCNSTSPAEKEIILLIFYRLTSSVISSALLTSESSDSEEEEEKATVAACVEQALVEDPLQTASLVPNALALACRLAHDLRHPQFAPDLVATMLVTALAPTCTSSPSPDDQECWLLADNGPPLAALKLMFSEMFKFMEAFPTYSCLIGSTGLFTKVKITGNPRMALVCQFLGRACRHATWHQLWRPAPSELLAQLKASCPPAAASQPSSSKSPGSQDQLLLLHVCVVVFRVASGEPLSADQQHDLLACLARATDDGTDENATNCLDPWLVYQLACKASLHRQPAFAADLFDRLTPLAITEKNFDWLRGLAAFNRAQASLFDAVSNLHLESDAAGSGPWVPKLSGAINAASHATFEAHKMILGADGRTTHRFQTTYVSIRATLYACLARLCDEAFHAAVFSPSGVCARWQRIRSQAATTKPEKMDTDEADDGGLDTGNASAAAAVPKSRRLKQAPLTSMRCSLPAWQSLQTSISSLIQRCVDADPSTLRHLNAILDITNLFIGVLRDCSSGTSAMSPELITSDSVVSSAPGASTSTPEDSFECAFQVLKRSLTQSPTRASPAVLIDLASRLVTLPPPSLPPFFFTRSQATQIRLILLPHPTSTSSNAQENTLVVQVGTSLVLRVMGVVSQRKLATTITAAGAPTTAASGGGGLMRTVTKVQLILSVDDGGGGETIKTLPLTGDYFSGEFCVNLTPKGNSSRALKLEAVLLEEGQGKRRWRLGSEGGAVAALNVRVEEQGGRVVPATGSPTAGGAGDADLADDFSQPIPTQIERVLLHAS